MLALAALDGVVLEAVTEAAPLAGAKGLTGPDLAKWIAATPELMLRGIAAGDASGALRGIAQANIGHTTFQKAEAIEGMLRGALGCASPWAPAAESLSKARKEAWTAADIAKYLDSYVERRNRIAHAGDLGPERRAASGIRYPYVREAVDLVRAVGHGVCTVVEARINDT